MDWQDVLDKIEQHEGGDIEFKRTFDKRKAGPAIAAFANTDGGVLILGVDDDGTIVGCSGSAETVAERLTSLLQTGFGAPVQARLGYHVDPAGVVHWVEVPRQRGFEPLRFGGRVYVRRGRSSVEPSPTELQELYNAYGYIITEERIIGGASISDVDLMRFRDYLIKLGLDVDEEPQPDPADDLLARGVIAEIDGALRPTLYGLMAFGHMPQRFPQTQNFWVECVAYAGLDRADEVLQVSEAKGRLDDQIRRAVGWLRGLGRMEHYEGLERHDTPLVPVRAAREAIVNAVAHRDYAIISSKVLVEVFDDRVEITSPGSLPNGLSVDAVRRGGNPRARNQSMVNFLFSNDFMEQRGRGWTIIRRLVLEHSGLEPQLHEDRESRIVRVTIPLRDHL